MSAYAIPGLTVHYGTVLDLQVEHRRVRELVTRWKGWCMLVGENEMRAAPGRARLYLVRGKLTDTGRSKTKAIAIETYERWHERAPDLIGELTVADEISHRQGRVIRIGYRSDKWNRRGATVDYDHSFLEDGHRAPYLYTDAPSLSKATAAVIVGGDMAITEEGID